MGELKDFLEDNYYTSLIVPLLGIIAIRFAINKRSRLPRLKFIPVYLSFSVLQSIFYLFTLLDFAPSDKTLLNNINDVAIIVFSLLEASIFIHLFRSMIQQRIIRQLLKFLWIAFLFYGAFVISYGIVSIESLTAVYIAESVLLALACVLYYYQLANTSPVDPGPLHNLPFTRIPYAYYFNYKGV